MLLNGFGIIWKTKLLLPLELFLKIILAEIYFYHDIKLMILLG
jgi:hypothetical protein